jgi:hypothetical protein
MLSTIIIALVILLCVFLLWRLNRKTKVNTAQLETVLNLLQTIDRNLQVITVRTADYRSNKKFNIRTWTYNRDRLEFISPDIVARLKDGFSLAEECNLRIAAAIKNKDLISLQTLEMEKMREPLNIARAGLIEWLKIDYEKKKHQATPPRGLFGF